VFLQGAILGLSARDLKARLDAILAFAELEQFADVPAKFYSSGMALRLGFAVAVHAEPDIFLIDEACAVGDQRFRERCLERIRGFKAAGVTMVLVSHERDLVERLSDRVVLLDYGRLAAEGTAAETFGAYERLVRGDAT